MCRNLVKFHLEGLGLTDGSEVKDADISIGYVRRRRGAVRGHGLYTAKPEGFLVDEKYEDLGQGVPGAACVRRPKRPRS